MLKIDRQRFGENIMRHRQNLGLAAYGVAVRVGQSLTNYQRWERGLGLPSLGSLCRLCVVLGCDVHDLLQGAVVEASDAPGDGPEGAA